MRAGKMRTAVTIEDEVEPATQTDSGHEPAEWEPIATAPDVWASIEAPTGLERVLAQQRAGETRATARIRYRADLDETMRLVDRVTGAIWAFDAPPLDPTGRQHELEIPVLRRG